MALIHARFALCLPLPGTEGAMPESLQQLGACVHMHAQHASHCAGPTWGAMAVAAAFLSRIAPLATWPMVWKLRWDCPAPAGCSPGRRTPARGSALGARSPTCKQGLCKDCICMPC